MASGFSAKILKEILLMFSTLKLKYLFWGLFIVFGFFIFPQGAIAIIDPDLHVTPTTLTFDGVVNEDLPNQKFTVQNVGRGDLVWSRDEDIDWLRAMPFHGRLGTERSQPVTVMPDDCTDTGTMTGTITVTGARETITISVTRNCTVGPVAPPSDDVAPPSDDVAPPSDDVAPRPGFITIEIENPLDADTFEQLIGNLINFIFTIAIALAPIMILIAAFYFLTAGGDPKRVETGKNIILYTVIGLLIVMFARGLVAIIQEVLK